jgi:hypothetical protein
LLQKEFELSVTMSQSLSRIKELKSRAVRNEWQANGGNDADDPQAEAEAIEAQLPNLQLSEEETELKRQLLAEGFGDWTRKDFRSFSNALEQFGRKDKANVFRQVSQETGKTEEDVERYFNAFNAKAETHLTEYSKVMEKIEKGEKKIARQLEISEALHSKIARSGDNAFRTLTVCIYLYIYFYCIVKSYRMFYLTFFSPVTIRMRM